MVSRVDHTLNSLKCLTKPMRVNLKLETLFHNNVTTTRMIKCRSKYSKTVLYSVGTDIFPVKHERKGL